MALSRAGSHPVNNILTKFAAEGLEQRFLCDSGVLPEIIVPEISGTFLSDDPRGYAGAADIDIARGRMGEFSQGVTFDPIVGAFNCIDFGHKVGMDKRLDEIIDQLGDLGVRRATQAARVTKQKAEQRLVDLLFGVPTGWVTSTAAGLGGGGVIWSAAASTPISDLALVATQTVPLQAFGERPDTIVLSVDVAVALNRHPETRGYLSAALNVGVGSRVLSANDNFAMLRGVIAEATGVDASRVFVGDYVQNTANLGLAGAAAFMWTNQVWMGKMGNATPRTVSTGNAISLAPTAAADFSAHPFLADSFESSNRLVQWFRASQANAYTAINTDLGFRISACLV